MNTPANNTAWPETLLAISDHFAAFFQRYGMPSAKSQEMAEAAAIELSEVFGGIQVYLPRGDAIRRELRDISIARRLGAESCQSLAMEYKLSQKQIWEITRKQREKHRRHFQE
ncbi:Mor transcription activator family protein [Thiothrix winogradskyi]|uniref:Mor transcription activator domain-containing protein n=1 Tax=Thiothrix winogradskyi TaxID=96472 RepID=A0ABY3T2I8_9GAMM|nr:Mor transcription activator family protein [Thiothrix winogradskyi]UJS26053.1 hypothetical protein L2Y54_08440 [Thiothrix winogradskyi]